MHSSGKLESLELNNQKDFRRQQERLKAMAGKTEKDVSINPDTMIENFLKESSLKSIKIDRTEIQSELPVWLRCESVSSPAEYKYFWSLVQSNLYVADTQKVSQLLLRSNLPLDVLGHIWNLANKVVPGQLTKQEFYIVLALVSLAQTGMAFNNLNVLKLVPVPVIPILQIDIPKKQMSHKNEHFQQNSNYQPTTFQHLTMPQCSNSMPFQSTFSNYSEEIEQKRPSSSEMIYKPLSAFSYDIFENNVTFTPWNKENMITHGGGGGGNGSGIKVAKQNTSYQSLNNKLNVQNSSSINVSSTEVLEDEFSDFQSVTAKQVFPQTINAQSNLGDLNDEFTDFQCITFQSKENSNTVEMANAQRKKEIPKIPLPKTLTGKFTDIKSNSLKISPESEKKLKVLSKNESLISLPESKISITNKVSTSISVLNSNHEIGSRLANHSLGAKLSRPNNCKQHKSKSSSSSFSSSQDLSEEEIIFGVNTKNLDNVIPKCCPKKPEMFILKETKINEKDLTQNNGDEFVKAENDLKSLYSRENTRKIEIPLVGTFNETVLPTQAKTQSLIDQSSKSHKSEDLFLIEEDKYSALRELELSNTRIENPISQAASNDDFGDFLAADIPTSNNITEKSIFEPLNTSSNLLLENESKIGWGNWNCNRDLEKKTVFDESVPTLNKSISVDVAKKNEEFSKEVENVSFDLLSLEEVSGEVSSICKAQKIPSNNEELSLLNFSPIKSEEKSLVTLSNETSCKTNESGISIIHNNSLINNLSLKNDINQSENKMWDLFAPSTIPSTSNLTRQDSLTSLDFKMSLDEESEQKEIWRKCLETCQAIIQEGVDILEAIREKEILKEVFSFSKTTEYLNGMKTAYEITQRISHNYTDSFSAKEDLDKLWNKLEKLSLEHNVQVRDILQKVKTLLTLVYWLIQKLDRHLIKEDLDSISSGTSHCKICLAFTGNDCVNHGGNTYHPSCANLWINCIDGNLPFAS